MYEFNGLRVTIHSREDLWDLLKNEHRRLKETTFEIAWPEKECVGRVWARLDSDRTTPGSIITRCDTNGFRVFTSPNPCLYYRLELPGICTIHEQLENPPTTLITNPSFGYTNKLAEVLWNTPVFTTVRESPLPLSTLQRWSNYVLRQQPPQAPPLVQFDIEPDIKALFGDKMAGIIMRKIK